MYTKVTGDTAIHYSVPQLRRDNPNTSFPEKPTDELLASYGVYPLKTLPQPDYNSQTHYLRQSAIYPVEGRWQCHYEPHPLPEGQAADNIRAERASLLQASDWVAAVAYERGEPVPQEWIDYRQQLRDIPLQPGFPWDTVFPEPPQMPATSH